MYYRQKEYQNALDLCLEFIKMQLPSYNTQTFFPFLPPKLKDITADAKLKIGYCYKELKDYKKVE